MSAPEPVLVVRDLTTVFRTDEGVVRAVDNVSFSLGAGRTIGIVGESGSGKSVTNLSILRLIPDPPGRIVSGEIRLKGENLLTMSDEAMRHVRGRRVAMIFQDPMTSLNPLLTIGRQMTEVLELHERLSPAAAKTRSIEMLAKVGIPDAARRFNQYPHQFSGGMRQRVMIAMALQCRPEVLLADEPTTALDVTIQAQILDLLRNLASELGTSMVLVTHDLGVVAGMANDILVMYAGRVVESASTEALFARPQHPYTIGLLRSLPGRRVIAEAAVGARASERHVTSGATAGVVSPALRRLASIPGRPPDPTALPPGCPFVPRCPWAFDRCTAERPPLRPTPAGNLSACWLDDPETLPQTRPGLWEMSA